MDASECPFPPSLLCPLQALSFRGDLWVVGAQNAGKSSLLAAMKRLAGTSGKREPTIAPVPGTTLGLLQVRSACTRGGQKSGRWIHSMDQYRPHGHACSFWPYIEPAVARVDTSMTWLIAQSRTLGHG